MVKYTLQGGREFYLLVPMVYFGTSTLKLCYQMGRINRSGASNLDSAAELRNQQKFLVRHHEHSEVVSKRRKEIATFR